LQQVPGILSQNLEHHLLQSVGSINAVRDGSSLKLQWIDVVGWKTHLEGSRKNLRLTLFIL
jgi:hypothetical protein